MEWIEEFKGTYWGDAMERIAAKSKSNDANDRHEDDDETKESEKAARIHEVWQTLKDQGVPERVIDYVLPNEDSHFRLKKTTALYAPETWAENQRKTKLGWCLALAGGKGCGKSVAAGYWLYIKARKRTTLRQRTWWSASRISRASSYDKNLDEMMQAPYMVIDDLGVEYMDKNGHFNGRLDELLEERCGNYLPTLITTNLNGIDFKERYGQRIVDRIREDLKTGGAFIEIRDKSLRGI